MLVQPENEADLSFTTVRGDEGKLPVSSNNSGGNGNGGNCDRKPKVAGTETQNNLYQDNTFHRCEKSGNFSNKCAETMHANRTA